MFDTLRGLAEDEALAKAYSAVARRAARMAPSEAEQFLVAVDGLLVSHPRLTKALGNFLRGAARADNAVAFIGEVRILLSRFGLSEEAIGVLGKKAAAGSVDVEWLNGVNMNSEMFEVMARDEKTPWRLYKQASLNPMDLYVGGQGTACAARYYR